VRKGDRRAHVQGEDYRFLNLPYICLLIPTSSIQHTYILMLCFHELTVVYERRARRARRDGGALVVPRSSVSSVRISSHALVAHDASRAEGKHRRSTSAKTVIFARESLRERSRAAGLVQPPIHEHRHALAAKRRIIRLAQYAMPSITLKHHQSIRHWSTRGNFTRHNRVQRPRLDCIARLRENNRRAAARRDVRDARDDWVRASRRLSDHAHVAIRVIHLGRFVPGDVLNPPFGTRASFEVCVGSARIVSRVLRRSSARERTHRRSHQTNHCAPSSRCTPRWRFVATTSSSSASRTSS